MKQTLVKFKSSLTEHYPPLGKKEQIITRQATSLGEKPLCYLVNPVVVKNDVKELIL